jgi:hypothetical protein
VHASLTVNTTGTYPVHISKKRILSFEEDSPPSPFNFGTEVCSASLEFCSESCQTCPKKSSVHYPIHIHYSHVGTVLRDW